MLSKGIFNTLSKPLGCLSMALGVFFLSMKLVREYIHIFRPYSFELFLLGPIFLLIGFRLVCRDVKFKLLRISSSLLLEWRLSISFFCPLVGIVSISCKISRSYL